MIVTEREISRLIQDFKENRITLFSQKNNIEETFFPKRAPKDGKIDLWSTPREIYNLVRGVTRPFPGAFLMFGDYKVTIWDAVPFDNQLNFNYYGLGQVIRKVKNKLIIKLDGGSLLINDYECDVEIKEGDELE